MSEVRPHKIAPFHVTISIDIVFIVVLFIQPFLERLLHSGLQSILALPIYPSLLCDVSCADSTNSGLVCRPVGLLGWKITCVFTDSILLV